MPRSRSTSEIELRTPAGMQYFTSLLATPLPTTGTVLSDFLGNYPLEQIQLTQLQARAVDGVALMRTPDADTALLNVIANTQANIVRARAVHDYLIVHGTAGRAAVAARLSPDQQILLDRFDVAGFSGSYDSRLAAYLALHPEVVPPPFPIVRN